METDCGLFGLSFLMIVLTIVAGKISWSWFKFDFCGGIFWYFVWFFVGSLW